MSTKPTKFPAPWQSRTDNPRGGESLTIEILDERIGRGRATRHPNQHKMGNRSNYVKPRKLIAHFHTLSLLERGRLLGYLEFPVKPDLPRKLHPNARKGRQGRRSMSTAALKLAADMPDPLSIAEVARQEQNGALDRDRRSQLGQFFTPAATARLMAATSSHTRGTLRLLDAGAGIGALTAAWVSEICSRSVRPKEIMLTAYELDQALLPALRQTLTACEAACAAVGIRCKWEVLATDFIESAVDMLDAGLFQTEPAKFDVAILNPPYKKFRSESRTRRVLRRLNIETSNLYTAFLALAVMLLDKGGELIAITPRSFCNGPYFRPFRKHFLQNVNLTRLHVFASRDHAFRDDDVLQENLILHAVKGMPQQTLVSVSESHTPDEPAARRRSVPFECVVRPHDAESFIHLVPDENGHALAKTIETLPCTLDELGLSVSTGRVVDFRARQWLRAEPTSKTVPLIYPTHFDSGVIRWPKAQTKKPNALLHDGDSATLLVPAGVYVLVRRFSAKEERRRLVAAIFDQDTVPCEFVGFENHLNYFHERGAPLERTLAWGLSLFMNSTPLDNYFRQFNGHTQVNATDLRSLRYPTRESLYALGRQVQKVLPPQDEIDTLIAAILKIP
jgi:adenine-specific DNA-methyltransferase